MLNGMLDHFLQNDLEKQGNNKISFINRYLIWQSNGNPVAIHIQSISNSCQSFSELKSNSRVPFFTVKQTKTDPQNRKESVYLRPKIRIYWDLFIGIMYPRLVFDLLKDTLGYPRLHGEMFCFICRQSPFARGNFERDLFGYLFKKAH